MALHFKQAGEGDPLILLHGLFGSLENLGALARTFSQAYCVYSLDLPNHGRSPHSEGISLGLLAKSVIAWMDEQGIEKASFLGHSLGGKVAMEIALRWQERIDKLVVMDIAPVQYSAHHDDVFAGLLALNPEQLNTRAQAEAILAKYLAEPTLRAFLLKNLSKNSSGGFSWRINLPVLHRDYANILAANTEGEFVGEVLFIKGELSEYIQELHREAIKNRFPNAQLKIVSGTQHWLHAEKPEMVAKIALRFLGA